jgi:O-antigen/teichoic acid export membrane protein
MAFPLGNGLYFQGLSIAIHHGLGPGAVVVFNAVRTLTRFPNLVMTSLRMSFWVEYPALYAEQKLIQLRALNSLLVGLGVAVAAAAVVVFSFSGPIILKTWSMGGVNVSNGAVLIFSVGACVNCVWNIYSTLMLSVNRHVALAWRYLLWSSLCLIMVAVVGGHIGLIGVGAIMLVCEIPMLVYSLRSSMGLLQQGFAQHCSEVFDFSKYLVYLKRRFSGASI